MSLLKRRESGEEMALAEIRGGCFDFDMAGGQGMLRTWHEEERIQIPVSADRQLDVMPPGRLAGRL